MEEFQTLKEVYDHLEEKADQYDHSSDISNMLVKLRNLKAKEEKKDEEEKAQWEVDFFNFTIINNKLQSTFSGIDKDGNHFEFPDIKKFTKDQFKYLIQRQKEVKNPLLKVRYSHILWLSPKPYKNISFAKECIEIYLSFVKTYEEKSKTGSDRFYLEILNSITNAYYISSATGENFSTVKAEIIRLAKEFYPDKTSYFLKVRLIELMLNDKKNFSKSDFHGLVELCETIANDLENQDRIKMLELAEKADIKLGYKNEKWQRQIAETWSDMSDKRRDGEGNIIAIHFCQEAIRIYQQLKDEENTKILLKKFKELKDTQKLGHVGHKVEIGELIDSFRKMAEDFSKRASTENIILALATDPTIIPTKARLEPMVANQRNINPMSFIGNLSLYDRAGNVAQHFDEEDEHEYYSLLFNFNWTLKLDSNHLIRELFFAAIQNQKLDAVAIIDFFKRYCWFGRTIEKPDGTYYNWLNQIAPAIFEYFKQMEIAFNQPGYYPNLVLSIDSLSLKIEGLIRDLCEFNGGITFYAATDDKKRPISREKDINTLLREKEIVGLLDGDDLLFLKFLLVEKAGYNIRNKTAHALMSYYEYTIENMHLLLIALLKLGKYNFKDS
jgi:hypothetical protein